MAARTPVHAPTTVQCGPPGSPAGLATNHPQEIAIDTHDMPFYGQVRDTAAEAWICGGKAKASTTWHYRCATATILTRNARLTIALMFVQPGTTMDAIVAHLLATIQASGITIACVYADRGFATVAVLQHLQQAQIPAIIALAQRGPRLRAHCQGQESRWVQHTMESRTAGNVTVKVAVVRTLRRTKRRRRRAAWCLFVCLGIRDSLIGIRQRYRARFGIESSYRQLETLRIRTTSSNPALRLMLVGIALVLLNVWVWTHWQYLRWPGRGPRRVDRGRFTLRRFQTFLLAAITAIYGQTTQLMLAGYRPSSRARSDL